MLAGKLIGFHPVCAVELDSYCRSILLARQRDGWLPRFPIWDDVTTFDGKPWRGHVDIITGGFPCQDISNAGKRAGISGPRSGLWTEFARIIGEVRPRYAFIENVPALATGGLDRVLADLAALGMDARWGCLGADDVGAPHIRKRLWILAYDPQYGWRAGGQGGSDTSGTGQPKSEWAVLPSHSHSQRCEEQRGAISVYEELTWFKRCEAVGNAPSLRCDGHTAEFRSVSTGEKEGRMHQPALAGWWAVKPDVDRVVDGVAHRVDQLRALGNGWVPQCAALAWRILTA